MKSMYNLNNVLATAESVGEWDEQEEQIAENVNKIYRAIYAATPEDIDDTILYEIMHSVWDDWGSEDELLTITGAQIQEYVQRVI
jgi:hypothetical protein